MNPDDAPSPRPARNRAKIPGFVELRSRADLKRFAVAARDVTAIVEPGNDEKDGVRLFVRAVGFFEVNESYEEVCRVYAAALDELKNDDRGY